MFLYNSIILSKSSILADAEIDKSRLCIQQCATMAFSDSFKIKPAIPFFSDCTFGAP